MDQDPSRIPKPEPVDPSWYPPSKDNAVISNIGVPNGRPLLPLGVSMLSLPVSERQQYMWHIPEHIKSHAMYTQEPETFVCKCEEKYTDLAKHVSTIEAQQVTITEQASKIESLQNQVKTMQTDLQSLHATLSQVMMLLQK